MSDRTCIWVRDRLPARATKGLSAEEGPALEEHLAACEACRAEARLVAALHDARPLPTDATRARVQRGVLDGEPARAPGTSIGRPGSRGRPAAALGGIAAAAVAALGSLWILAGDDPAAEDLPLTGEAVDERALDVVDEWVVAGEPVFSELPEEALEHLLQEMDE